MLMVIYDDTDGVDNDDNDNDDDAGEITTCLYFCGC